MKSVIPKLAIFGDIVLVLWVIFNAIDSHFSGTAPEKASFVALILLLLLNASLIYKKR